MSRSLRPPRRVTGRCRAGVGLAPLYPRYLFGVAVGESGNGRFTLCIPGNNKIIQSIELCAHHMSIIIITNCNSY